jgi:cell division septation protein DedD
MQEQTTWKGHAFTLVVFAGIVVLCSIFFILGMLVGRAQGQKIALATVAKTAAEGVAEPESKSGAAPELTFYESVKKNEPAPLEPPPPSSNVINFQIGAFRQPADAEKLLDELKRKAFRGFILAPAPGDPNPLFRVQAGPYNDDGEVQAVKLRLESAGYEPMIKK